MPATPLTLEDARRLIGEIFVHHMPFNQELGLKLVHFEDNNAQLTFDNQEKLVGNITQRILHGGVIAAVLDVGAGLVCVGNSLLRHSTFTQEQVDAIFTAAAFAANDARLPLAKMAVAGAEAAPGGGLPCRRGGPAGRRGGLPACCLPDGRTVALGGLPCTLRDAHVLPSAAAPLTASLASLASPRRDGHGCRRGQGEPPADWPPAR